MLISKNICFLNLYYSINIVQFSKNTYNIIIGNFFIHI